MINILIPLAPTHTITQALRDSVAMQDAPCEIISYCSPIPLDRYLHEAENRNYLKTFASVPYTMLMDADILLTTTHDVSDLIAGLDSRPDVDALALDTKPNRDAAALKRSEERHHHVCIGCMMIRSAVLSGLVFRQAEPHSCICVGVNKDLGDRIKYLDYEHHVREVKS